MKRKSRQLPNEAKKPHGGRPAADEREPEADERERLADERDRGADERESKADDRETEADKREQRLFERAQELRAYSADLERRTREAIDHSRQLLADRGRHLDQEEAALHRPAVQGEWEQGAVDRATARSAQELAYRDHFATQAEHADWLRSQLASAAAALAATEEKVAKVNDKLAASRPELADKYRHIAELARQEARKAREIERTFSGQQGQQATGHDNSQPEPAESPVSPSAG